jgi:hypothetical protein
MACPTRSAQSSLSLTSGQGRRVSNQKTAIGTVIRREKLQTSQTKRKPDIKTPSCRDTTQWGESMECIPTPSCSPKCLTSWILSTTCTTWASTTTMPNTMVFLWFSTLPISQCLHILLILRKHRHPRRFITKVVTAKIRNRTGYLSSYRVRSVMDKLNPRN